MKMRSHDGENTTLLLRCLSDPVAYFISDPPNTLISSSRVTLSGKPLQKGTIDTMLCHPVKVSVVSSAVF